VRFVGKVPPTAGVSANDPSSTIINVSIVEGVFGVDSSDHPGHGPFWGGLQNVDNYLKYGVGLYKVTGTADGRPNWHCDGSGYIQLKDGNPLTKPIGAVAAGLAVLGAAGAAGAARAGAPDASSKPADKALEEDEAQADAENDSEVKTSDDLVKVAVSDQTDYVSHPEPGGELAAGAGCLALIVMAAFVVASGSGGSFSNAAAVAGAGAAARPARRRVWSHGHPILGFISGLVAGLGLTVVIQQFAIWPLTILTAIVFPVVVAILCGVRAHLGRPYRIG
jgi:hypothetical protein